MKAQATIVKAFETRVEGHPAWVLLVELFIGLGWIRAAVEKIISRDWWSGDVIGTFVADHSDLTIGWYVPLLDRAIVPSVSAVSALIVVAQLAAGLSLLLDYRPETGLFIGMSMNINFVMIGAVDPSIFYLILQASLALWFFENRTVTRLTISYLKWILGLAVVLVIVSAPYIRTIDPSGVVEDPAMILVTYGLSIGLSSFVALRRLRLRAAIG